METDKFTMKTEELLKGMKIKTSRGIKTVERVTSTKNARGYRIVFLDGDIILCTPVF